MACCERVPVRVWICVMLFFATYVVYVLRSNISISLPAMVTRGKKHKVPECKRDEFVGNSTKEFSLPDNGVRSDWDENAQGRILGAYGVGNVIGSLPAGIVAEWLGPYWTLLIAILLSAVCNSLSVPLAVLNDYALSLSRVMIGFFGGFIYPALHTLISRWAPPAERGRFIGALMGNNIGTAVTWYLVAEVTEKVNWYWGFHVSTIQVIVFCVCFFFMAADSPDKHRWITLQEVDFIKAAQEGRVTKAKAVPPYLSILTSLPFWALTVAQTGNLWGMYFQLTAIPKFLNEVVGFKLTKSGILGSLPHLTRMFVGLFFGFFGDYLVKNEKLSKIWVRKGFMVFSHILPGVLLLFLVLTKCNPYGAVAILTMSLGLNGASCVTHLQNNQELAPNFAGSMWGIVLFISAMSGFLCPIITGILIKDESSIENWGYNFVLGGLIYIASGIFFILFGSTKVQPWNEKKEDKSEG